MTSASKNVWNEQTLTDSLKRGEIYPLYLFYGDETFLIDEAVTALKQAVLTEGLHDFNFSSFHASETDPSEVRDAVETLPIMAPARIVLLKEAHELADKKWELLLSLIEQPVPTTAFICVASKIDKRKKHFKRYLENGVAIEFKRPYEKQIPDWIRELAKRHGLQLSLESIEVFRQLVGSNLQDIHNELNKLAQYLGVEKKKVGPRIQTGVGPSVGPSVAPEQILHAVSRVRIESVFDLTDAIGAGDLARALDCLVNLLDHGQNEVGVLALISRHVRILKLVTDGLKEGLTGGRLSSRAGVSPYFLKSYVDQARTWNERKIERTFEALLDTDRALKSSPVASHIWLENFIVRTCAH